MSDTRFSLIGVGFVFAGFLVLGVFGSQFMSATVQLQEFDDCYEYPEDGPPVPISCDEIMQAKTAFFALVIGLIAAGVLALIKGVRGDWDQRVRPEDMVGPGHNGGPGSSETGERKD